MGRKRRYTTLLAHYALMREISALYPRLARRLPRLAHDPDLASRRKGRDRIRERPAPSRAGSAQPCPK